MKITKKIKTAGLFTIVLVFSLFIISCRSNSKKVGEKIMEKAIENATGQDAKVDLEKGGAVIETGAGSIKVDGNAKIWPIEIPGDIPEFKFGKVEAVTTSNLDNTKSWTIAFKEVQNGFLDKYDAQLKEKGFESVLMKMGDSGGSIQAENSKYNVFLMGGEGNLSLAVSIKKQE